VFVRRDGIVEAGAGHPPVRCRVVVLAKEPEPGLVKTRLCPPLLPSTAAECHEAFVVDTLSRVRLAVPEAEAVLAVSPAGSGARRLREIGEPRGWRCVEQGSGDLGRRMEALLCEGVASGCRVVLLGADTPDLPARIVRDAFAALRTSTVVLGPATDGGYYLVGCRDRIPPIFGPELEWGTAVVWEKTLLRLRETDSGGEPAILPPWYDVDEWSGLVALAARVERQCEHERDEDDEPPLATIELFRRLRTAGFSF
jgi:rSAM/selenodomain-associated transferase 1